MRIFCILLFFVSISAFAKAPSVFRLHLSNEPASLDPNKQRTSASSYLLGNLYRNIFYFDDAKGLVGDLGVSCRREKTGALVCELRKDLAWSDGSVLTAEDFLRTYRKILDPKTAAPRADLLFKVKNAQDIYLGKKDVKTLGITAPTSYSLRFEFASADPDFEYNLASFILAPTKADLSAYSGPYKLSSWKKGQKIQLEANTRYYAGFAQKPLVEFLFIEEDTVALQLYEKNELHFLRRLPTLFLSRYKNRPDFHWIGVTRLDYIGFGPSLADQLELRKALTHSLNFPELQKIFSSEGVPGCVGVPASWFPDNKLPCFQFDLKKAPKGPFKSSSVTFMFSGLGGEDHKRATEWMQNQWKKNIKAQVNLEMKENKIFLQTLNTQPPPLFRKGVSLDRPTCLAALETFAEDSAENFIRLKSTLYTGILKELAQASSDSERKRLCLAGMNYLMDNYLMIPLGGIHFSILAKPAFTGWKLNQMNQLDLQALRFAH